MNTKKLTTTQIETLLLFARGLPIGSMATQLGISKCSINSRLQRIQKKCPLIFDNAYSIRNANKRLRISIRKPISLEDINDEL